MKRFWIAALVVIPALTSGCGTILNFRSGDPEVYGGIQKDVEFIMTPPAAGGGATNGSGPGGAAPLFIVAADAALSLVADTLTLPMVIRKRRVDQGKEGEINLIGRKKETTASGTPTDVSLGKPLPLTPPR